MNIVPTERQTRHARRSIIRSATVWLPFFGLFAAGAVFFLVRALTDDAGTWVGFAILGLIALLMLPLLIAALQDLRATPIETEGPIARKWTKADLLVFRGHYFLIGKRVFRVEKTVWLSLPETPERVHLLHYPHTNTLIDWQRAADHEDTATPSARAWRAVPGATSTARGPSRRARAEPLSAARPQPRSAAANTPLFGAPEHVEPPRFGRPSQASSSDRPEGGNDHA
jgi:hypothetical protein